MKSRNDLDLTFMGNLRQAWYACEVADVQDIHILLKQLKGIGNFNTQSLPLLYLIDYSAQQYLLMTNEIKQIAGYHPTEFLESNLAKLIEVYHKDDFKIFNEQIFTRNIEFLTQTPKEEHANHIFSYNFRVKHQDKRVISVLQRGTFITSLETGRPIYSLGMIVDISDYKTDTCMVHTIERVCEKSGYRQVVDINRHYPNFEDTLLTRKEKLVLQHLSEGQSSKQIADKLFVSERTIINHKQNMLRKTNTKNATELVVFGIRNRII